MPDPAPNIDRLPLIPRITRELLIAVLAGVVTAFFVALASADHLVSVWTMVLVGIPTAMVLGWAIWLAWGPSRLVWRLPIVLIFAAFASWLRESRIWYQEFIFTMTVIIVIALVVAVPRCFSIRWDSLRSSDIGQLTPPKRRQFQLTDLFGWTAAVALIAGLLRWGAPLGNYPWNDLAIIGFFSSLIYGAATLISMWVVLSARGSVGLRMLFVVPTFVLLAALIAAWSNTLASVYAVGSVVSSLAFLMGGLYVLRHRGHRLVRAGGR